MSWRIAESLKKLREQINAAFPKRSKVSDGAIGDAAHASRSSDHNPWVKDAKGQGIVTAIDITHDPKNGVDCNWLAKKLVESRDKRIKYIIWDKQIISSTTSPWKWRTYTGVNAHSHHLHISVNPTQNQYDSRTDWDLDIAKVNHFVDLKPSEIEKAVSIKEQIKESEPILIPATEPIEVLPTILAKEEKIVAIEKTEKKGFWSKVWKEIAGLSVFNGGVQAVIDYIKQVAGLPFSPTFWTIVGIIAAVGSIIYLIIRAYHWRVETVRDAEITSSLISANSTENNTVILANTEILDSLDKSKFEVVKR